MISELELVMAPNGRGELLEIINEPILFCFELLVHPQNVSDDFKNFLEDLRFSLPSFPSHMPEDGNLDLGSDLSSFFILTKYFFVSSWFLSWEHHPYC